MAAEHTNAMAAVGDLAIASFSPAEGLVQKRFSRAIHSCPYCGIPVASIFVSTGREAGCNSSALRTAAPERTQGPWPERWSGWKVLTAGDPTFSRRFT